MDSLKVLLVGDVVGATGRAIFQKHIARIKSTHAIDAIIVNGENSSALGRGITPRIARFFKHNGASVITTGNHIWKNKEIYSYLEQNTDVLKPANFPSTTPGVGVTTFNCNGTVVGVINVQGRVFMHELVDCPFKTVKSILTYLKDKTKVIFIDFHAETTSEKMAMGHMFDGCVSGIVGTHTHVQTADERILPGGTAFITDLGMAGSVNGMLGMKKEQILDHFLRQMPVKFEVDASMPVQLTGVIIKVNAVSGKAITIERIRIEDTDLHIEQEQKE